MAEPQPKKYNCPLCKEGFPTYGALVKHGKTSPVHRARFGCDICDKGFLKRSFQQAHQLKHHPIMIAGALDKAVAPTQSGVPDEVAASTQSGAPDEVAASTQSGAPDEVAASTQSGAPEEVATPKERGHPCRLCDVVLPYRKNKRVGGRYQTELAKHLNSHEHRAKESALKEKYYQEKGWDEQSGMYCSCKRHFTNSDTFNKHMLFFHAPRNELDSDQSAGLAKEIETVSAEDEHENEKEDEGMWSRKAQQQELTMREMFRLRAEDSERRNVRLEAQIDRLQDRLTHVEHQVERLKDGLHSKDNQISRLQTQVDMYEIIQGGSAEMGKRRKIKHESVVAEDESVVEKDESVVVVKDESAIDSDCGEHVAVKMEILSD